MRKNILIDLNVVVDVLLERSGFAASADVLKLAKHSSYTLCMSGHTVTTLAYLLAQKKLSAPQIRRHIDWAMHTFRIVPTNEELLRQALTSPMDDYEDAVIDTAALSCNATAIITRNIKDFEHSRVTAYTPEAYLAKL